MRKNPTNMNINQALEGGYLERTQPYSRSPTQRYRLTRRGHRWLQQRCEG